MGFIGKIFEAIANLIKDILQGIGKVLKWIGQKILPILAIVLGSATLAIVTLGIFAPGLATTIALGAKAIIGKIAVLTFKLPGMVFSGTLKAIKSIGGFLQNFFQLIHFKELLALHKIGMILSPAYRETMNKVYKEISDFSYQVFGSAEMLHMLIQSSRTLIYSLTSSLGLPYDVAEIEYVQYLDVTLQKISANAERYAENPEAIFDDLAEWVYTPVSDKYSQANGVLIQTLTKTAEGLENTAETVFLLNEQSQAVAGYLPSPIRGKVQDILNPVNERISRFEMDTYRPKMQAIDEQFKQTNYNTQQNKYEIQEMSDRIINPAKYLEELNKLPEAKRRQGKIDIDLNLSEPLSFQTDELNREIERSDIEVEVEREKIKVPEPEPQKDVSPPEVRPVKIPFKPPPKPGWFVGDY